CPVNKIANAENAPTVIAILNDFLNISKSCLRAIFHALIPAIKNAPVANDVNKTCGNCAQKCGFVKIDTKSFICARPSTISNPTRFCMIEFAVKIKNAEIIEPNDTSQTVSKCTYLVNLFHPKTHSPINAYNIPGTTPIANVIKNNTPQNFVIRLYISSPLNTYNVCMIAIIKAKPIDTGTKK